MLTRNRTVFGVRIGKQVLLGKYRRCLVEMTKAAAAASKRGDNDTPMSQQPK
eukprot:m.786222 g.786222  ORF g.786222 m.786222 type:complete len:52 (+) comp23305_c1_seq13:1695-1850(+)